MNNDAHRIVALNVDDNEEGRYAVSRALKQADFEVIDAANGHDALRLSLERKPDVVLLDVKLPDIPGFEVCRRLRSDPRTAGIPVLHVSATFLDDISRVKGLEGGADGYLTKPIDPLVLIASIKALLRVREAEKKVREAAREWQSTFESIRDGIAIFDSQGRMLRSNGRFQKIFKSAVPLPGAPLSQLLGAGKVAKAFLDLIRTRQRVAWEQNHGEKTLAITFDPFEDDGDAPPRMVCIVSDISERKKMENRLQHTQKLESLGLLAGGVAHDFNNILTGILCNASFALECLDSPDKLRELLPEVVTASRRAADLVRQLLAYAGGGRMTVQPVHLSQVVRDIAPLIRTSIGKMVTMNLQLDESIPAVHSDATQLQQLAMNLIINAGEAIGDSPGTITVVTRSLDLDQVSASEMFPGQPVSPGRYVSLEVSDTGCGMDQAVRSRIFDPFFTTKFFGRGLGLSAAVGIIRAHEGAIHVESHPGSGSRFHIVLPATAEPLPQPIVERAPHSTGRGTILLVDDEETVRKAGTAILERYGYTVLLAADGLEGVKLFEQYRDSITLVVLDLAMPVMSGEEAIPLLQDLDPDVKILVSTGYSESMVAEKLGSQGVFDTLQKPFTSRALIDKISRYDVEPPPARLHSGK